MVKIKASNNIIHSGFIDLIIYSDCSGFDIGTER